MQIKYFILLILLCLNIFAADSNQSPQGKFSDEAISFDFALGLLKRGLNKEAAIEFSKFISRYPSSKLINEAQLNQAEAYFNNQQFSEAAKGYYNYLQHNPKADPILRLRYGICLYELKQYKSTLDTLIPLQQLNNKISQSALYYVGLCLEKIGKFQQAKNTLLRVRNIELKPSALYTAADIALKTKKYKEASAIITQLIKEYPAHHLSEKARLIRANALRLKGDLSASANDFTKLINSNDSQLNLNARYGLAWTYYGNNQLDKATELIKNDLLNSKFTNGSHYLLGLINFKTDKYDTAINYLSKVTDSEFSAKAILATAWAYYKLNNFKATLTTINKCQKLHPNFMKQELCYLAGRCYWQKKDYIQAAKQFAQALKFTGNRTKEIQYELATAYHKSHEYNKAVKAYSIFIQNYSDDKLVISANTGLADSLIKLGRYEAAVPIYLKLLKNTGSKYNPQYLQHLAVCYYHLKQYNNMARSYQTILKHYPKDPSTVNALFWLGWYYSNSANFDKAISYYTKLIKLHPKNKLSATAQYDLALTYLRANKQNKAAQLFFIISQNQSSRLKDQEHLWLAQFYFRQNNLVKSQLLYSSLLKTSKSKLTQCISLRGLAKIQQNQKKWQQAAKSYQLILDYVKEISKQNSITTALINEAYFGLARSLRELKQYNQARQTLNKISISVDDPFRAKIYYEQGLLDFANKKYKLAIDYFMRVGLLIDDQELAGAALLKAAQACEIIKDYTKAKICYEELAGKFEGSYGQIYPQSKYTFLGKKKLKDLSSSINK